MKQNFLKFLKRIDWINSSFLLGTPILGIGGGYLWVSRMGLPWETMVLFLCMTIATGVAITGGYHRLFSHKSFDAKGPFRLFVLLFGAAAFENSALRWSSDHRNHHKFVDTDQDPYNIKRGFWYAHMGWVMLKFDPAHRYDYVTDNVADLKSDPLVMFQHRHYMKLGIFIGLVMPTLIAALWGDALGGFLLAGVLRTVTNHHFTFSINSFAHLIGKRPYSDQNTSRDNWFLAFFTYGEGYHNYHHKFPSDYRNGIKAYHWDPTKWLVEMMENIGQTYNLRQTPNETILRAKLKMDEKRIIRKMMVFPDPARVPHELVVATRERIEEAYAQFRTLKAEYQQLKQARITAFHAQVVVMNTRIEAVKADIRSAQEKFKKATIEWKSLCSSYGVPTTHLALS